MDGYNDLTFKWLIQELYDGNLYTGLPEYQRKSWVKYCYHFSNINNIASILNSGILYSRNESSRLNIMGNDNASSDVIEQTAEWIKDYVRFYFRPKTPTQYNNEGFRNSLTMTHYAAHCPLPVFLLFDLNEILNLENSYFTSSSLANNVSHQLLSTPQDFQKLPFSKIYHDSYLTPDNRDEIVSCRHAEVVVSHSLHIDGLLQKILVRSAAEKRTLMSLLSSQAQQKYGNLIQVDSKRTVFLAKWEYIEDVLLTSNSIKIRGNNTGNNIQFTLKVFLQDHQNKITQTYINDSWIPSGEFTLGIAKETNNYFIKIYLNDNLAFCDNFEVFSDLNSPF